MSALQGAALAAVAGAVVSYFFNTIPGLKDGLDKVPSKFKPLVLLALFVGAAIVVTVLKCQGLFDAGVVCPSSQSDVVKLVVYTALAYGGSQVAHETSGRYLATQITMNSEFEKG